MKNLYKIVSVLIMGLLLNSCYYDTYPEGTDPVPPEPGEEVSYSKDIMPLWNADCVSCHKGNIPPDLRNEFSYEHLLDGYVVPFNSEESILYKSLLGDDGISLMPPDDKWPNSKIDWVKLWIDQGAKDN